jgi:hypothetical protein
MNEARTALVKRAFGGLDKRRRGSVNIADLKKAYRPRMHPDVQRGIRSVEDVLQEFMDTFDMHRYGKTGSDDVTYEEFEDYYANVSASVEEDDHFAHILESVWAPEPPVPPQAPAASKMPPKSPAPAQVQVQAQAPVTRSPGKKGVANISSIDNTLELGAKLYNQMQSAKQAQSRTVPVESVFESLKKKLAGRGARGLIGLAKQFQVRGSHAQIAARR